MGLIMQSWMKHALVFSWCVVYANATAAQSPLDPLRPLLGVWDTRDIYYPAAGDSSIEIGVRTCELVMNDTYIQCETRASRAGGRARTYRFMINYNRNTSQFEMLSIWSNVPHKAVYALTPQAAPNRWRLTNVATIGVDDDGAHFSDLVFESAVSINWTGRRVAQGQDPTYAPVSFRETWRKRG
jgi:hypothetical protein